MSATLPDYIIYTDGATVRAEPSSLSGGGGYVGSSASDALQWAINQGPGTIALDGNLTWTSVPKLPPNLASKLRIVGTGSTIVTLSTAGPRFLDFDRTADYQTFQNIELSDLTIDAGNTTGKQHVVLGNFIAGLPQLRMNFDRITLRRIRTVNVNSGGGSVATIERANVYLVTAHAAGGEGTQTTLTNVLIEDLDLQGGAHGIVIGPFAQTGNGATGSLNTNAYADEIHLNRCRHDTGIVWTSYWASANFSLGGVGKNGRCTAKNLYGKNAGDPGMEMDGWDYFEADTCLMEDSGQVGYVHWNYDNIRDPQGQMYVFRNCHYRRTNAAAGIGWAFKSAVGGGTNVARGAYRLDMCSFYMDRPDLANDGDPQIMDCRDDFQSILINDFKAYQKGFTYTSNSVNRNWQMFDFTHCAGSPRINLRNVAVRIDGNRTGTFHVIPWIVALGGGTIRLNVEGMDVTGGITNQGQGTFRVFGLGQGVTTNLRGSIKGVKLLSVAGDVAPMFLYLYETASLTIPTQLRVEDCDLSGAPAGSEVIHFNSGFSNANKVALYGIKTPTYPIPSAAMGTSNFAAATFTSTVGNQYIGGYPAEIHFANGTGAAITKIESSKDGVTYEGVWTQASGVMANDVYCPVDNGDFIKVTFATTQPTTRVRFKK